MLLISACSSEETYQPGPTVAEGCQEVHFDESNEAIVMLDATGEGRTAVYTLTRSQGEGRLTVPVIVHEAAEGVSVPQSVTFAEGETTTTFEVTTPAEVTEGSSFTFDVELTGDNVNPYTKGITRMSGIVAFPRVRQARMNFTNMSSELGFFRQSCYDIGGGRLCFPDFMHSGTDVWMLFDEKATYSVDAVITTSPSYVEDDMEYPGCVMVWPWDEGAPADDPNGGYTTFKPHGPGSVLSVEYMCMYYGEGWSGYNPATGVGYIGLEEIKFNIKNNIYYWTGIQFSFVDPETDTTDYSEPDFGIQPPIAADGTVLDMAVRLSYNDFGLPRFENVKATVGNNGTSLTFEDFMHSGITFTLSHGIDNSFKISSSHGVNETGTWQFKEADGQWMKLWPAGAGKESIGLGFNMHSDFNQWNVAGKKIVLVIPAIYSFDYDYLLDTGDRITFSW